MTTGIVIVVHAPLGAAMRECASHVMGNLDGMLAIHDIQPEDRPDDLAPDVLKDILEQEHGGGVLVLTDLIGATPANIAKRRASSAACWPG
jgi:PTS system ascorbate-specific IIA component